MSRFIISNFPKKDKKKVNRDLQLAIDTIISLLCVGMVVLVAVFITTVHDEELPELKSEPIVEEVKEVIVAKTELAEPKEPIVPDEEIMASVVMAEAEGEPMLGKVAVAATILNRADAYGQTIETVVNMPNQYAKGKEPNEECFRAVEIAMENRDLFPADMLYFRAYKYHSFGEPYLIIGNHYFSTEGE